MLAFMDKKFRGSGCDLTSLGFIIHRDEPHLNTHFQDAHYIFHLPFSGVT